MKAVILSMEREGVLVLLTLGIFIALFLSFGIRWKKHNELPALLVFCGALTLLAVLYLDRHADILDRLENHPKLTVLGVIIAGAGLLYRLFRK